MAAKTPKKSQYDGISPADALVGHKRAPQSFLEKGVCTVTVPMQAVEAIVRAAEEAGTSVPMLFRLAMAAYLREEA